MGTFLSNYMLLVQVFFLVIFHNIEVSCGIRDTNAPRCSMNLDLDVCFPSKKPSSVSVPNITCHPADLCKKQFFITYMNVDPYTVEIVKDLLRICCGPCINMSTIDTINKVAQIEPPSKDSAHLIFPVLGEEKEKLLYEHYFIPLIKAPSIYYITHKPHDVMHELLNTCINMWPLMVISLLMVMVSGFLGWLMETWSNKEDFPRPFLIGWFEGFWWSFISMTTVGYGDKVPKSVAARLYSIFWIFVGIVTFSIVTALLSSAITKANTRVEYSMAGEKVGALRYRIYDAMVIAHHGGILVNVSTQKRVNSKDAIKKMIQRVLEKTIEGFVLDKYMLLVFYNTFQNDSQYKNEINFLKNDAVRTEVSIPSRKFYGILAKNKEDYDFFVHFVKYNREVFDTCNSLLINTIAREQKEKEIENPLFATSGEVFWPAFTSSVGTIVLIFIFGIMYEFKRKSKEDSKSTDASCTSV